jgi:MFS family permease
VVSASRSAGGEDAHPPAGGWAPLRFESFRRLWLAQFVSNVGSWMQTVAAQWLMLSLTGSALFISAIPAAASIPVLLFAVPAGALGDLVDRRRLIVGSQIAMLAAATALAGLAAFGWITPWVLLALLFALGVGGALSAPTWQTLQPELVPSEQRPQAIALGSVNQNLARAIGPAIGGLLLAATSAALVFLANAVSFVAVLLAVVVTAVPARTTTLPREHAAAAVRAGGRYVANSPALLALLVRTVAFIATAGALWALLPLVARNRLGLGSAGYGLLLGCVGLGALAAATFGPSLKRRVAARGLYALSCLAVAGACAVLATTHTVALVAAVLIVSGAAWIMGIGLLGSAYQGQLPAWVKARGVSYYLLAFQGASGVGSLCVGVIAEATSVSTTFVVIAAGLLLAAVGTWRLALPASAAADLIAEPLPLPSVPGDLTDGPILVTVDYAVVPGNADAFLALAWDIRALRRRTGASRWHLHRDVGDTDRFIETFLVGSWQEHERQHARLEHADRAVLDRVDALLRAGQPRSAQHSLGVRVSRVRHQVGSGLQ